MASHSTPIGPRLTHINGVSIEEIESRSAPLEDSKADSLRYRVRSSGGFLDPGESLLDRLDKDQALVTEMGVAHLHLAQQLERLLQEAIQCRKVQGKGPDACVAVSFLYAPCAGEKIAGVERQLIYVSHRSFVGAQWSFFRNLARLEKTPNETEQETEEDTISWKEDHEIYNDAFPHIKMAIAGGVGTGICHYIAKHGFYEGGKRNPYRVDPALLHCLLSGIPTYQALTAATNFYQEAKRASQERFDAELAAIKTAEPPVDAEQLSSFTQFLQRTLENELAETDGKLQATATLLETLKPSTRNPT